MFLFIVLLITLIVLISIVAVITGIVGAGVLVIFGDVIIFIGIIAYLIYRLFIKKKKRK